MEWQFVFFTICNLVIPVVMIAVGFLIRKVPPKTVNKVYGYRTKRSMKDENTWLIAHRLYAVWVTTYGCLAFLFAVGLSLMLKNEVPELLATVQLYVIGIELIFLFLPILHTESMLKHFENQTENEQ